MVDVRAVANWFLSRKSLTHKQIQKLCYYAQAWYCALYDGNSGMGSWACYSHFVSHIC